MTEHDAPQIGHPEEGDRPTGELPAAGGTTDSQRTDIRVPDASGTVLTITDAVERFAVSAVTLGRRVRRGEVPAAYKRPGPKGDEWVIPVAALVGMGYHERGGEPTAALVAEPTSGLVADLKAVIDTLSGLVALEQRQLTAAQADRTSAQERAADLGARLELTTLALEERTADLGARLELTTLALDRERARADTLAAQLAARPRRFFHRRRQ